MITAGKVPKLANPKSPAARVALHVTCPSCNARRGSWCVNDKGRQRFRLHYARAIFKGVNA